MAPPHLSLCNYRAALARLALRFSEVAVSRFHTTATGLSACCVCPTVSFWFGAREVTAAAMKNCAALTVVRYQQQFPREGRARQVHVQVWLPQPAVVFCRLSRVIDYTLRYLSGSHTVFFVLTTAA